MKKNMKKKHFHFHLFLFITLLLFLTPRIHAIRRNKFSTPSTSSSSSRQQGFHPWKNNNNSPTEFQLLIFGDKPQYPERVYHSSVGTKKERKVSLHLQPCTSFEQIQAI
ncbi:hypothetical protein Ahy_A07g031625 isoform B [Arachis hypogaea]|uniref:Uncharacterized protein n=1 Tax=Arachis hypogaea TaxID=3818 RepID=A0A445C4M6_ARAHY|nr:hypothetical protein Ahy_A07g031625 isoform B [Arachis hypogaea]